MTEDAWTRLTAVLREMPDVTARLLADHVPDPHGRCRTCTQPGQGTPSARFPCTIASIATEARHPRRRPLP